MKLSLNWLQDSVDIACTPEQLSEIITTRIAEVEALHLSGAPLKKAIAGKITEVREHPERKQLKIVKVAIGASTVEVICTAPNAKAGLLTAYIPPGGEISIDDELVTVTAKEMGGVVSQGVLASEKELGIGPDQSGVFDLMQMLGAGAGSLKPGDSLEAPLGGLDWVIEIENKSLTHRPDLWSHHGLGADLAAVFGTPVKRNPHRWADDLPSGAELLRELTGQGERTIRNIEIDPKTKARRFTLLEFRSISVKESPYWMRRRLATVGAGVRGLLVDLSNYVMHDIGAPNHVFDRTKVQPDLIFVRPARKGEKLLCLDGVERIFEEDDIVVADKSGPLSVGGIIGGTESAVQPDTKEILFECASWDPVGIRRIAKRHQLRTDASNRFEKNLSPHLAPVAPHRYAELLRQIDPGVNIQGSLLDVFPLRPESKRISVPISYFPERMGASIDQKQIVTTLTALRCDVEVKGTELSVRPPYDRAMADVTIKEDLVEEVARCFGIENIPPAPPTGGALPILRDRIWDLEHSVRDLLRANSFSECSNYSFLSAERAAEFGFEGSITILNPIDKTQDAMRVSLIPNLVDAVERNLRHADPVPLFEIGRAHLKLASTASAGKNDPHSEENRRVALALGGSKIGDTEFYGMLSVIRKLAALVTGEELRFSAPEKQSASDSKNLAPYRAWQHPFRAACGKIGETVIASIAEVSPQLLEVKQRRVIAAEIDLQALLSLSSGARKFQAFGRFPESFFEISAVLPKRDQFRSLETLLQRTVPADLLRRIEFLDHYEGTQIGKDEKSISVRLVFGSGERTLSSEELRSLQDAVMKGVQDGGYRLRGV